MHGINAVVRLKMKTANQIKTDIEALSKQEYLKLVSWFSERDWKVWDNEIYEDSQSGKLDFLFEEAMSEKSNGILKEI